MTRSPVYLTDLACSERLTIWTIRRLAGEAPSPAPSACGRQLGLFLPCFRQEFLAVSTAFHEALSRMAALKMPSLDIRVGSTLAITPTEYSLLLATEAAQNERESDVQALLRPLLPFPALVSGLASAITTLGACLAGAGYWLSRHAITTLVRPAALASTSTRHNSATGAALSLSRWHDFDVGNHRMTWPLGAHRMEESVNHSAYMH
ncbi:hypothetical protein [Acetobacter orientalis]|uniref:hypothetical protein n=1 Tax=Acetobacter orientalis TaxID=146474 RepID=UPI0039ECFDB2